MKLGDLSIMSNLDETASQTTTKAGSLPASTINTKLQIGSDLSGSIKRGFFPSVSSDYINEIKKEKQKAKEEEINPESLSDDSPKEENQTQAKKGFKSW